MVNKFYILKKSCQNYYNFIDFFLNTEFRPITNNSNIVHFI